MGMAELANLASPSAPIAGGFLIALASGSRQDLISPSGQPQLD